MNDEQFRVQLENILKKLPDPQTHDEDECTHAMWEVDLSGDVRPTHGIFVYLVFVKNEEKNKWVLDRKYYPKDANR